MSGKQRWLTMAAVLGAALAIQSAAFSETPPKQSTDGAVPDRQKLNGVWLVRSAEMNNASAVGQAWTSKITIKDGGFTVSHFCGSSKDRKGKFTLDPAATPKTVDLEVDEIDLSELWEGVTYPKCSLRGIYELKNDTLTICLRTGSNLERPKDFEPKGKNVLALSLDRVQNEFTRRSLLINLRASKPPQRRQTM